MNKYELSKLPVQEIVQRTLRTLKCSQKGEDKRLIITLSKERIKQYVRNGNILLKNVFKYVRGEIKNKNSQKLIIGRLKRSEINVYMYKRFIKLSPITFLQGLNKFDEEKHAPDLEVHFLRDIEFFIMEMPGKQFSKKIFEFGHHVFLTYGIKRLNDSVLERIETAKKHGIHLHVAVSDDTVISQRLIKEIYSAGADIIRVGISNRQIEGKIRGYKGYYKILTRNGVEYYKDYKREENLNIFETPVYQLVKKELGIRDPIEIKAIIEVFGDMRIIHSMLSAGGLKDYYKFIKGETCDLDKLIGRETHVKFYWVLKKLGASEIKYETLKYENMLVDYKCVLNGSEEFIAYQKGVGFEKRNYSPGVHVFEIKASGILNSKVIEQLVRLKFKYENAHLVIMRLTIVHDAIYDELKKIGIDIVYFHETKVGIYKDLRGLKSDYEKIYDRMKNEQYSLYCSKLEKAGFKYDKSTFLNTFGYIRVDSYLGSGLDINDFHTYYFRDLKGKAPEKTLRNKLYFAQLNTTLVEKLDSIGAEETEVEHIKNTNASEKGNLKAVFSAESTGVMKVIVDGKEKTKTFEKGNHVFLPTFKNGLNEEMLKRVQEALEKYENVHVVIHNEAFVDRNISKQIYEMTDDQNNKYADIIVLDTTPEIIRNQVNDLGKNYFRAVPKSK